MVLSCSASVINAWGNPRQRGLVLYESRNLRRGYCPIVLLGKTGNANALRGGARCGASPLGLFPPGKGGNEEVAYGRKGKGILIHTLTEGGGMPLANSTTAANKSEREQIFPLLNSVKLKTLKPSRPKKRVKVWQRTKGLHAYKAMTQRTNVRH